MRFPLPALLLLVATTLGGAPACADQPSPPSSGSGRVVARGPASVTLQGRGYGHGHGMSQNGAQGAALKGKGYRQIMAFYYPHTNWGRATGKISVWITEDKTADVIVQARSGLTLRAVGSGKSWRLSRSGARRWRILPVNNGADSQLQVLTSRWITVRTVAGQAQFSAGGAPMRLYIKGGSKTYRGALRSAGAASRNTVNIVPLETYLRGVVPQEMPALWKPAAVQSQAVAARTYAAYERRHPLTGYYQICDTSACQVYGGAGAEYPASDKAVKATAHKILTYAGKPAFTQFSASNGGWSAAGGEPYLVAKQDPYDCWSGNSNCNWTTTIRATAIERAYPGIGDFQKLVVVKRDGHGLWNGRVVSIRIVGAKKSTTLSGDTFRSVFGLKSTWFRLH